jgi:putative tricarboxylic transport membrane protein
MDKVKAPVAPLVVGLILGQMLDVSLHQSLIISGGSWWVFFQSPVSAVFLALAVLSLTSGTGLSGTIKKWLTRPHTG